MNVRTAPQERSWMNSTSQKFAYRCLPMAVANSHGWHICNGSSFSAEWDGSESVSGIVITPDDDQSAGVSSHFGYGILTFSVPCVFRTDAGVDLMVTGPFNSPKDGIYALSGIVETDWSPSTFTMNWKFTRPGKVRFELEEPFCLLYPVVRETIEKVKPQCLLLSDDEELHNQYLQWSKSRQAFLEELPDPSSRAAKIKWQKDYFLGSAECPSQGAGRHRTRLRLPEFFRE
ncbi:DUF6065 family protein [Xanthomonas citri pv. viticola]|nr:DUF6065 family protein [Xanthomonas citri]